MNKKLFCERCGNSDPELFFELKSEQVCRCCLIFKGEVADFKERHITKQYISLKYPLTLEQDIISEKLLIEVQKSNSVLINAVCGAGKTEIITKLIKVYLDNNKRVGIVIPRKDLVIEIGFRMKNFFPKAVVTLVYGRHHEELDGDIIIFTAHQAYRYKGLFEILIIDEIDAFPYYNNQTLINIVKNACIGKTVCLSATPSQNDINNNTVLTLKRRYHLKDLPVPKTRYLDSFSMFFRLIKELRKFNKRKKICFIYVPTIDMGLSLYYWLKFFIKGLINISSKTSNREEIISNIHKGLYKCIITTTILERGVTFKGLQVIVYHAENNIFEEKTLIQMAGRVGRNFLEPDGEVIFLSTKHREEIDNAIKTIFQANSL
ncbi:MAG: DEAD/DEAH box helicase family protein [Bacillales bacterium]|jgi:competence protein ComFA|nr:DEAD/DEAH box helicase family protein [Bacillales bacterium]